MFVVVDPLCTVVSSWVQWAFLATFSSYPGIDVAVEVEAVVHCTILGRRCIRREMTDLHYMPHEMSLSSHAVTSHGLGTNRAECGNVQDT
jgi:hypothetical protein